MGLRITIEATCDVTGQKATFTGSSLNSVMTRMVLAGWTASAGRKTAYCPKHAGQAGLGTYQAYEEPKVKEVDLEELREVKEGLIELQDRIERLSNGAATAY